MKSFLKKLVAAYLGFLCRIFLKKKRPKVIGITGSYGKTSMKDATFHLLSKHIRAFAAKKSLNTEFGFTLGIFDLLSGYSNPLAWITILIRATFKTLFTKFSRDVLVLEYGCDKPGDISYLLEIVKPDIGILTTVAPVHLGEGQFSSIEEIFEEKKKLLTCLNENDLAIFNGDHPMFSDLEKSLRTRVKTFGENQSNDIFATDIKSYEGGISGILHFRGKTHHFNFPILGKHHVSLLLTAILVGENFGISVEQSIEDLKDFSLQPGRFSRLKGKHGALLLDSSYNASPETMEAALEVLAKYSAKRRIAVLGSMNELGQESERYHRSIGRLAPKSCEYLMTVGDQAEWISDEAKQNGMAADRIKTFETAEEAGMALETFLQEGDVVLFKGSQNRVRLERAIQKVLADPGSAKTLLTRQEAEWENH